MTYKLFQQVCSRQNERNYDVLVTRNKNLKKLQFNKKRWEEKQEFCYGYCCCCYCYKGGLKISRENIPIASLFSV